MNEVNKTLYIPLYGKALVSRRGILLNDPMAEKIWEKEGFALRGKAASKWLAYYMGMRARVFDDWLRERMAKMPDAVVIHIGCGMDSRVCRVDRGTHLWYDVDFPQVIDQRSRYYPEEPGYRMIASDATQEAWLQQLPGGTALVVMEGVSMYLDRQQLTGLLHRLQSHFDRVELLTDCYTRFGARASRYKNPINQVGVTRVYGVDDPRELETGSLGFRESLDMTPEPLIRELPRKEQGIFRKLFAGSFAGRIYRLYAYTTDE